MRRQNQNYCRASPSLSPLPHISLRTSILQLLLVYGMWWFSIPPRKTVLIGRHLFHSGQEERRLIPWHFKKVTGERTSSLPAGRAIWPWQASGSWDFLQEAQPGTVSARTDGERTWQWGPRRSPATARPASGTESNSPGNKIGYRENEQPLSWLKVPSQEKASLQAHGKETEKFLSVRLAKCGERGVNAGNLQFSEASFLEAGIVKQSLSPTKKMYDLNAPLTPKHINYKAQPQEPCCGTLSQTGMGISPGISPGA